MQDVGAPQAVFAGQRIDLDLGHRRAIREIKERPAPVRCHVVMQFRRGVIARGESCTRARCVSFATSAKLHERHPPGTMPPVNATSSGVTPNSLAATPAIRSRIAMAATCAALPFRSLPDDAAVGDVFGTFAVLVAVIFTRSMDSPNSVATTRATFIYRP